MNITRMQTGVYYYQRKIPLDLVKQIGKKKFMYSLKTKDRAEAIRLARIEGIKHDQLFSELRNDIERAETITTGELKAIAFTEANRFLETEGDKLRANIFTDRQGTIQAIENKLETYVFTLSGVSIKNPNIARELQGILDRNKLPKGLPESKLQVLAYHWLTYMIDILKRLLAEFDKPWDRVTAEPLSIEVQPTPDLGDAIKSYLKDAEDDGVRKRNVKYLNRHKAAMRVLEAYLGFDRKLRDIRHKDLKELRTILTRFPANVAKKRETKHLSIERVIQGAKENEFKDLPALSPNTINGYLQVIKELFDHCIRNDWLEKSPYDKTLLVPVEVKAQDRRLSFKPEYLTVMFTQHDNDDFKKWGPRIAVSMGLRLNEICQLQRENFREIDGYMCIQVAVIEGQRAKTEASRRTLPIPQKLIDAGFVDWLASRPKGKNIWGFTAADDRYLSDKISKDFSRWCTKLGLRGEDGKDARTFHSLRHTYRDAFREQEIPREIAELLGGWTVDKGSVADSYGEGLSLGKRKEYLDLLKFPKGF